MKIKKKKEKEKKYINIRCILIIICRFRNFDNSI